MMSVFKPQGSALAPHDLAVGEAAGPLPFTAQSMAFMLDAHVVARPWLDYAMEVTP